MTLRDENNANTARLRIQSAFSKEDLAEISHNKYKVRSKAKQTLEIRVPTNIELVEDPETGEDAKYAYGMLYDADVENLTIELHQIGRLESRLKKSTGNSREAIRKELRNCYKNCVYYISPRLAGGWNRWSEDILTLFLSGKLHRILWGSGNCGKSQIYAVLLYIKWRVRPDKRMVVVASRVITDARERVIGYIKKLHAEAPPAEEYKFMVIDSKTEKAIYTMITDRVTGKEIKNDHGCIIALPIKVKGAKDDDADQELGSNLMGKHPEDVLVIALDECQELPGTFVDMKIFSNWYTNPKLEVHGWGNPNQVNFHDKKSYDLLFRLGAGTDTEEELKEKLRHASKTTFWTKGDTDVLHLSMLDSPKDDPEEVENYVLDDFGERRLRLEFLAGKANAEIIAKNSVVGTPSWHSQVLGFPYIDFEGNQDTAILSVPMVNEARKYPLEWLNKEKNVKILSCDPALGSNDDCSYIVAEKGLMRDNRQALDFMNGRISGVIAKRVDQEFADTVIEKLYEVSTQWGIPLNMIVIDTHAVGDVFRYSMLKHIEQKIGKPKPRWFKEHRQGLMPVFANPSKGVTTRILFRQMDNMQPAKEIVGTFVTELYWAFRCFVLARQIFNVPETTLQEFYRRYYKTKADTVKVQVQSKDEMREQGITSPNKADAAVNLLEVARNYGFKLQIAKRSGYIDRYGEDYENWKDKKARASAFGEVSRILGFGNISGLDEFDRTNRHGKRIRRNGLGRFRVTNL